MNPVYENILTRRSCRAYTDKPISAEALQAILAAGASAPSAMNKQTRQFTVLRTEKSIAALAQALRSALNRPAYDLFKPAALVIVSNDPANPNSGFDCACSLENIFLAAHSFNIASCWINQMKDVENAPVVRELLTTFGVPVGHHVFGMASLGYAVSPSTAVDKSAQVIHYAD